MVSQSRGRTGMVVQCLALQLSGEPEHLKTLATDCDEVFVVGQDVGRKEARGSAVPLSRVVVVLSSRLLPAGATNTRMEEGWLRRVGDTGQGRSERWHLPFAARSWRPPPRMCLQGWRAMDVDMHASCGGASRLAPRGKHAVLCVCGGEERCCTECLAARSARAHESRAFTARTPSHLSRLAAGCANSFSTNGAASAKGRPT